uniref:Uncharacterized protein n=1 Tax=Salix viminalis TaxID=40686 RepID=A0A6N2LRP2_SALVM
MLTFETVKAAGGSAPTRDHKMVKVNSFPSTLVALQNQRLHLRLRILIFESRQRPWEVGIPWRCQSVVSFTANPHEYRICQKFRGMFEYRITPESRL